MRILLILLLVFSSTALAQENQVVQETQEVEDTAEPATIEISDNVDPYAVTDVVVDVTADDAVVARAAAFKKGSEVAVQAFLEAQGASTDLRGTNPDALVKSFKVDEEHFSDTRYKARLSYKFKPRAIAILANQSLPFDRKLPVPVDLNANASNETLFGDPLAGQQPIPFNPDAAWNPDNALINGESAIRPDGRSARPDSGYGQNPVQRQNQAPNLSSWQLTVRFNKVPDWLLAQSLISARPEVRGFKIATMSSNFAILNMTSLASPDQILSQWSSLGWRVTPGAGGLVLDAGSLR